MQGGGSFFFPEKNKQVPCWAQALAQPLYHMLMALLSFHISASLSFCPLSLETGDEQDPFAIRFPLISQPCVCTCVCMRAHACARACACILLPILLFPLMSGRRPGQYQMVFWAPGLCWLCAATLVKVLLLYPPVIYITPFLFLFISTFSFCFYIPETHSQL